MNAIDWSVWSDVLGSVGASFACSTPESASVLL
jgi:hypothetical protein